MHNFGSIILNELWKIGKLLVVFTTLEMVYWLVSLLKCIHRKELHTFFSIGVHRHQWVFGEMGNLALRQQKQIPNTPGTKNGLVWGLFNVRESAAEWNLNLEDGFPTASPLKCFLTKEVVEWEKKLQADYALEMKAKKIKCQNYGKKIMGSELWSTPLCFQTKRRICIDEVSNLLSWYGGSRGLSYIFIVDF